MNRRVLVVDDDSDIRETLRYILEDSEYEVAEAENGKIALIYLDLGNLPDIILLDMMMPIMDGIAFLQEIQRRGMEERFFIFALSANPLLASKALQSGARGYFHKPFDIEEMLQAFENCA